MKNEASGTTIHDACEKISTKDTYGNPSEEVKREAWKSTSHLRHKQQQEFRSDAEGLVGSSSHKHGPRRGARLRIAWKNTSHTCQVTLLRKRGKAPAPISSAHGERIGKNGTWISTSPNNCKRKLGKAPAPFKARETLGIQA